MIKKFDFLSQPITLFYQGNPSHPSNISGILSIITLASILSFSIYHLIHLFNREKEIPKSTTFTYFVEDAPLLPLNASSLFHFINLKSLKNKDYEEFDFSYFNIIGIYYDISNYESDKNISNYEHWLYGLCNENDIIGIKDIATQDFLKKSACIRKYYDSKNKIYYDTNDPNFKWPVLAHGTFNNQNIYYSIIVKTCEQNILRNIFDNELICKEINELDMSSILVHLNFVEEYIDISKYNNPVGKYFYRLENKLDNDNYKINHIIFNPSAMISNDGYIIDKKEEYCSHFYDKTDVFTFERKSDIYMGYTFYLSNRMRFYERTYQTIQDILSLIGGISTALNTIMIIINNFFNKYKTLSDFNYLLNVFDINTNDIKCIIKKNIINKKIKDVERIKRRSRLFAKQSEIQNMLKNIEKENKIEEQKGEKEKSSNQTLNTEKSEDNDSPNDINSNNKLEIKNKKENSVKIFKFWEYFVYKIIFCKKDNDLKLFEKFRKQIISVEHLIENFLRMNNLLKSENLLQK